MLQNIIAYRYLPNNPINSISRLIGFLKKFVSTEYSISKMIIRSSGHITNFTSNSPRHLHKNRADNNVSLEEKLCFK